MGIFDNFERNIIDQVLKQYSTLDEAFSHLTQFVVDFNSDNEDEDMEESKEMHGGAAQGSFSQMEAALARDFNDHDVYRVAPNRGDAES